MSEKLNQDVKYDASTLKGCEECEYHKFGPVMMTDEGMTLRCIADPVKGLTVVAESMEKCQYYIAAQKDPMSVHM